MRGRIYVVVGLLAVAIVWVASAAANYYAGTQMSSDPDQARIFGAVSIASDILKAVSLFAIVSAIAISRPYIVALGVVIFGMCALWSLRSASVFAFSSLTNTAIERQRDGVILSTRMFTLEQEAERLSWLREQTTSKDVGRRDKVKFSDDYNSKKEDIDQLIATLEKTPVASKADPLGEAFSISDRTMIIITGTFLALLLEIISATGFVMILRSQRHPKDAAMATPAPAAVQTITHDIAQTHRPFIAQEPALRYRQIDIILNRIVIGAPGGRVAAKELLERVNAMAPPNAAPFSSKELSNALARMAIGKSKMNGRIVYHGITLAA